MTLMSFYGEYAKHSSEQNLPSTHIRVEDPTASFRLWTSRHDG